jgi:transposase InsO family protein
MAATIPSTSLVPVQPAFTTQRPEDPECRPAFPARFPTVEAARFHCQDFFRWYNNEHRHGALGLHTAADVHHGHAAARPGRTGPGP